MKTRNMIDFTEIMKKIVHPNALKNKIHRKEKNVIERRKTNTIISFIGKHVNKRNNFSIKKEMIGH